MVCVIFFKILIQGCQSSKIAHSHRASNSQKVTRTVLIYPNAKPHPKYPYFSRKKNYQLVAPKAQRNFRQFCQKGTCGHRKCEKKFNFPFSPEPFAFFGLLLKIYSLIERVSFRTYSQSRVVTRICDRVSASRQPCIF